MPAGHYQILKSFENQQIKWNVPLENSLFTKHILSTYKCNDEFQHLTFKIDVLRLCYEIGHGQLKPVCV